MNERETDDQLPERDSRMLTELIRDSRLTPPPVVDYDRFETTLFAKLDQEPVRLRPRSRVWLGVSFAAAAAAAVFFVASRPASPPVAVAPPPTAPVAARGASEHVEAGASSRSFTKEGLATWVLEAGAVADVTDEGERVVVALRSGAIHVDVVPQPVKERFVVVAERTRVAVHGTSFRVARVGEKVDVDVERGVVAVGAVDGAPRWMVEAPRGGTFQSDGATGELRALAPFSTPAVVAPSSPKAPSSGPRTSEKRADLADLRARATGLASDCFQRGGLPSNVHVTVDTTMKLVADANGAVTVSFDPPLAPAVEACVREGMRGAKAQAGSVDAQITLVGRK